MVIQGNYIGTDVSGTRGLGSRVGVLIFSAEGALIGGTEPGAGNLISGNIQGLSVSGNNHVIQGNFIGTNFSGTAALPN